MSLQIALVHCQVRLIDTSVEGYASSDVDLAMEGQLNGCVKSSNEFGRPFHPPGMPEARLL